MTLTTRPETTGHGRCSVELLTRETFTRGLRCLARRDADLARIIREWGPPPMWVRPQGFATLLLIILEQQVSLASARAAFTRLRATTGRVTPRRVLILDDATFKGVGFSRQKIVYARHLAEAILLRRFRPAALAEMSDEATRTALIDLKGIGPWSADIYLLMALRRPDVWPRDDLALAVAAQSVKRLASRPTPEELDTLANPWRPWRAIAARLLWHQYLSSRRGRPAAQRQNREVSDGVQRFNVIKAGDHPADRSDHVGVVKP